jgi:hypothetical protein
MAATLQAFVSKLVSLSVLCIILRRNVSCIESNALQTDTHERSRQSNMMQCLPRTTNFNSYSIEFKFVFDFEVLVVERNPNRMSLDHMSPAGHWQISAYRYHLRPYLPQIQFQYNFRLVCVGLAGMRVPCGSCPSKSHTW